METLLEWQSPEHHFDRKTIDWYWGLGIISIAGAVLAFYFDNFLFGIFIIIAALTVGILSYKETRSMRVGITSKGVVVGKRLYPFRSIRSFWIEEDHIHGPRILLHPMSNFLPLISIHINNEEVSLGDVYELMAQFLDEEYLEESIVHKWFERLLAR
ncbi:MAG: hypothetical protein AAB392_00610 [Patescibacteria group bacterium]